MELKHHLEKVSKFEDQVEDLEAELADVKTERDDFREDLSQNRARVAELTSLAEAQASRIRDLERQLERLKRSKGSSKEKPLPAKADAAIVKNELIDEDSDIEIIDAPPLALANQASNHLGPPIYHRVGLKEENSDIEILDRLTVVEKYVAVPSKRPSKQRDARPSKRVKVEEAKMDALVEDVKPVTKKHSQTPEDILSTPSDNKVRSPSLEGAESPLPPLPESPSPEPPEIVMTTSSTITPTIIEHTEYPARDDTPILSELQPYPQFTNGPLGEPSIALPDTIGDPRNDEITQCSWPGRSWSPPTPATPHQHDLSPEPSCITAQTPTSSLATSVPALDGVPQNLQEKLTTVSPPPSSQLTTGLPFASAGTATQAIEQEAPSAPVSPASSHISLSLLPSPTLAPRPSRAMHKPPLAVPSTRQLQGTRDPRSRPIPPAAAAAATSFLTPVPIVRLPTSSRPHQPVAPIPTTSVTADPSLSPEVAALVQRLKARRAAANTKLFMPKTKFEPPASLSRTSWVAPRKAHEDPRHILGSPPQTTAQRLQREEDQVTSTSKGDENMAHDGTGQMVGLPAQPTLATRRRKSYHAQTEDEDVLTKFFTLASAFGITGARPEGINGDGTILRRHVHQLCGGSGRRSVTFTCGRRGRAYLWLDKENCPNIPESPGEPTVVFIDAYPHKGLSKEATVFFHRYSRNWEYAGEYTCNIGPLKHRDFNRQSKEARSFLGYPIDFGLTFQEGFVTKYLHAQRLRARYSGGSGDPLPSRKITPADRAQALHAIQTGKEYKHHFIEDLHKKSVQLVLDKGHGEEHEEDEEGEDKDEDEDSGGDDDG
ncbi:hypothetical protein H0H81_008906 [Sphagnurus paluster]|uniref:DUF6697 domain-containing protein n=1 Tax=Sphagnurus paluster TaxID=117069 RepID=A0A9P7GQW4_9AGAR|nr:hypothetical protein H0H81_008906 [Sphagnurus paluster]